MSWKIRAGMNKAADFFLYPVSEKKNLFLEKGIKKSRQGLFRLYDLSNPRKKSREIKTLIFYFTERWTSYVVTSVN